MRGTRIFVLSGSVALALFVRSTVPAHAAWPHSAFINLPMCTATNHQSSPVVVSDGAGGAIITWRDSRTGTSWDVYAQHVLTSGAVDPAWPANGRVLCASGNDQIFPVLVTDGTAGAIVAWEDHRGGNGDVYVQRVSAAGVAQWTTNGVALCTSTGNQQYPTITADDDAGAIVAWQDSRSGNTDVYAQHVLASGVVDGAWPANGRALCTAANNQAAPMAVTDGARGAIVVWEDNRGGSNWDVYAQHVLASGAVDPAWPADGRAICTATGNQQSPAIVADGSGGALITWRDYRSGNADVYAQRLMAGGFVDPAWLPDGRALCTATGDQLNPTLVSDGSGGAIVTWDDYRGGNNDIYAQHLLASGAVDAAWPADGRALCTTTGNQQQPSIVPDGAGGAIVAWQDFRSGNWDVYAQHVLATGTVDAAWPADGRALSTATNSQAYPRVVTDGAGGAIATWQDYRSGSNEDIYAQQVERFGYLGSPKPVIASVRDVPNDQGGKVKLSWYASWLDPMFDANLAAYDVLRSVPAGAASLAPANGRRLFALGQGMESPEAGDIVAQPLGALTFFWEYLGSVSPLHYVEGYSYLAPTTGDSVGGSNPLTLFMVVGRNSSGTMFWLSAPDSGYSVDDLAPATPIAFTGQYASGTTTLHWDPNGEADLAGYRLYRGTTPDFTPGPGNRVAEPADTGYVDVAGAPHYYKLCAVDVHGNASGYSLLLPSGTTGVEGPGRAALALSLASANPARGSAVLRWALPAEGPARLVVYDLAGRVVRELATGRASAGEHTTAWDGRDGTGAAVGAGLYLVRLEAAGRVLSVRLALVR